ncbi:MAG TPA: PDZ domain-containing protein [Puia sp.]|nr:PDZ domain-containing protein [Puia sp.]
MNKHLLQISGLAIVMLTCQITGSAQKLVPTPGEVPDDDTSAHARNDQEIIIRQKSDKDAKVTVEFKNGEVLINGKPATEYEDANVAVTRKKVLRSRDGRVYMDGGDMAMSPFRKGGAWNFEGAGQRAFLGVSSFRPDNGPAGAKIGEITPGSAAEKAGLKQGDLITRVDEIGIQGPEDLSRAIGQYQPDDKVTLTITRDGKEQKITATLGRTKGMTMFRYKGPDNQDFEEFFKNFNPPPGAYNFNYNNNNSPRLGIRAQDTEDGKGVKVLHVDGESVAAKAGIKEGDIITAFDGKQVNDATSLAAVARESRSKPSVHISVLRDGKALDLEVKTPRKLKTADL